jgi:hypothetical protein
MLIQDLNYLETASANVEGGVAAVTVPLLAIGSFGVNTATTTLSVVAGAIDLNELGNTSFLIASGQVFAN